MSKVCLSCGTQIEDNNLKFCPNCGKSFETQNYNSGLLTAAKILMIISCIAIGWTIIPLFWLIPMTCKISKREKSNEKLTTTFKVCTLLFGNTIAGILLLCDDNA